MHYNLSLSLPKARIFPQRFEFVGVDVSPDGNRPALSKHILLKTWPDPRNVHDVAKFISFIAFYALFIPLFELRIATLRDITKEDYSKPLGDMWTAQARAEFAVMKAAILADPCIKRFDSNKLVVIRTDFSSFGFSFVVLQPGNNAASISAANDYREGKGFTFMT